MQSLGDVLVEDPELVSDVAGVDWPLVDDPAEELLEVELVDELVAAGFEVDFEEVGEEL